MTHPDLYRGLSTLSATNIPDSMQVMPTVFLTASVGNLDELCIERQTTDFHQIFETEFSSQRELRKVQENRNCPFCRLITTTLAQKPDFAPLFACAGTVLVHIKAENFGSYSRDLEEHISISRLSLSASNLTEGQVTPLKGECWIQRLWEPSRNVSSAILTAESSYLWGRREEEKVNLALVQSWIDDAARVSSAEEFETPDLIIDIKAKMLVPAPTKCQYAALSYVWGPPNVPQLKLTDQT
jgi:hypothetical protein